MKKLFLLILVVLLAFSLTACDNNYTQKSTFVFSDSNLSFSFSATSKNFDKAYSEMLKVFEDIDNQININRQGESDVLRLNLATSNQEIKIGYYTYQMISLAKQIYKDTDKAFNISTYPLTYLWGIDAVSINEFLNEISYENWKKPSSFINSEINRGLPLPTYEEVQRVKEFCDLDKLNVFTKEDEYYATKQDSRLMIDLGGIAKGYAVDLCVDICNKYNISSALINLSGNLFMVGDYKASVFSKTNWEIGVSDPKGDILCAISAPKNSTAVTSGDYERFRTVSLNFKELNICHIINSSTGLPYGIQYDGESFVNDDIRITSCTVLTGTSAFADCYATAACVMGFENAISFFNQNNIKAILITADKKLALTGDVKLYKTDLYDNFKGYQLVT